MLPALNGLRVSKATGADIEDLGIERGHRTLVITRKGGKIVTIPLRVPPARLTWPSASAPKVRSSWTLAAGRWTGTSPEQPDNRQVPGISRSRTADMAPVPAARCG